MAEISKIIRKQQSKLVDTLARKSHFKQDEVEGLLALYRKLSEGAEVDRLDRTRFRHLHSLMLIGNDFTLEWKPYC